MRSNDLALGLNYFAYLAGYRFAHEVCQDELFSVFRLRYMRREGVPTRTEAPGADLDAYCLELIALVSNEHAQDSLPRLCAESSDQIPKWLVPVIRENVAAGLSVTESAAIVASWAHYAEGMDEVGELIDIVDRRQATVIEAALRYPSEPLSFIRNTEFFGDLANSPNSLATTCGALDSLHEHCARKTPTDLAVQ